MGGLGHFLGVDKASVEFSNEEGPCCKVRGPGLLGEEAKLAVFPLLHVTPHALEGEVDLLFLCHVVECKVVIEMEIPRQVLK